MLPDDRSRDDRAGLSPQMGASCGRQSCLQAAFQAAGRAESPPAARIGCHTTALRLNSIPRPLNSLGTRSGDLMLYLLYSTACKTEAIAAAVGRAKNIAPLIKGKPALG